ncbi:MAG: hypothetical protein AAF409_16785 [Pseudomonadota bacterium]
MQRRTRTLNPAPERQTLAEFLGDAAPRIAQSIADGRAGLDRVVAYLLGHLDADPDIAAQLRKFQAALPGSELPDRASALREARSVLADVKQRWIKADAPPLVDEIDDRLGEIGRHLDAIEQPDTVAIADAARQIDTLSDRTRQLEGLEQRLTPYAIGAFCLFLTGLFLFFRPMVVFEAQPDPSSLAVLLCLGALPALGTYYAIKIKPRSRTDAEIDALNRRFFLPNGGIYFPGGPGGACVIRVAWTPPPEELPLSEAPRDPRKDKDQRDKTWW